MGFVCVCVYRTPPFPLPLRTLSLSPTFSKENRSIKKRDKYAPSLPTCPPTVQNYPNPNPQNPQTKPINQPTKTPPSLPPSLVRSVSQSLSTYTTLDEVDRSILTSHRTASPRRPDRQTDPHTPPGKKKKKKTSLSLPKASKASTRPGNVARGDEKCIWGLWSWIMHCTAPTWRDDGGEMMEESMVGR